MSEPVLDDLRLRRLIRIDVEERDGCVDVAVADDGRGFDPQARSSTGVGLTGMRERVELADGGVDIDSGPAGTTVRAKLPVPGGRWPQQREEPSRSAVGARAGL